MTNDELVIEPESHIYTWQGAVIPSCTQILRLAQKPFFVDKDRLAYLAERGRLVHKAVELDIRGDLDRRTLAKDLKPYLTCWREFVKEYDFKPYHDEHGLLVERPVVHISYRYGVRPDVVGYVKGNLSVVEIKATSVHSPVTALQTAAQRLAVRLYVPETKDRYAVRLREGKSPDVQKHTDPLDEAIFLAALNLFNWRMKNKLL